MSNITSSFLENTQSAECVFERPMLLTEQLGRLKKIVVMVENELKWLEENE